MHLQGEFISVLARVHPEIFETMREAVLPLWRIAVGALQKLAKQWQLSPAEYPQLAPYSACLNVYEAAQQVPTHTDLPECLAARAALEALIGRYNIAAGFVWDWAAATMNSWLTSAAMSATGEIPPVLFGPVRADPFASPREPVSAWDPLNEPLATFKTRVERHVRDQQAWARRQGLRPARETRVRGGRTLRERLSWLVQHRVDAMKYDVIAAQEIDRGRPRIHWTSVREAVAKLEAELGFPPAIDKG